MAESRTPLPPFAALRAFHAAAVHARFRDAAAALGVTESAISHQVRRLEDFLRTSLFDRSGPGVRLTAAGRRYLEEIDPAIRQIQAATQAVLRPAGRDVARLTLPPSLAATWLIPRLGAFERAHPDVDLQLVPTTPPERGRRPLRRPCGRAPLLPGDRRPAARGDRGEQGRGVRCHPSLRCRRRREEPRRAARPGEQGPRRLRGGFRGA